MAASLPPFPRFVFTKLEPISLLAGFLGPVISPKFFISAQLPQSTAILKPLNYSIDPTSTLLAWQLGNAYLLLGLLGIFILNTTTEVKVVRAYLWALLLGDVGHVGFTVYAMGWDGTVAWKDWSSVTWGNVAFTVFLFLTRCLYLAGFFDSQTSSKTVVRKTKGRGVGKKKR
ncbi:hypothetical protein EJ08DRAFT_647723 [Tothia fuscella]|uniref:DUF7704 domain-containing protein n=1 Tax=Tothia fuscella TaxID=1048955 RepID=A0A9P4U100_9PEZI|nr:hypothetical protein EJ08DRAFT_647723 [Tothia fuscella]